MTHIDKSRNLNYQHFSRLKKVIKVISAFEILDAQLYERNVTDVKITTMTEQENLTA